VQQLLNRPPFGSLDNRTKRSRSPENTKRDRNSYQSDPKHMKPVSEVQRSNLEATISLNDRVVWLNNGVQYGIVKYIGKVDGFHNKLVAGIEFVSIIIIIIINHYYYFSI